MITDLILIHGFWSSPATWDSLAPRIADDPDLKNPRIHRFGYRSPRIRLPGLPSRIPAYDDIVQVIPEYLETHIPNPRARIAIVTHSQGGLILQRFLAWMLQEGRGRDLRRIRLIVMLACPNEGSEYLHSIRAVAGFAHHPQAKALRVLDADVGDARRIILRQIINASTLDERNCQIPFHVYSGDSDNVVRRESAQSVFPNTGVLPGDHFSILDPDAPGSLTLPVLKRLLVGPTGELPASSSDPTVDTPPNLSQDKGDIQIETIAANARPRQRYLAIDFEAPPAQTANAYHLQLRALEQALDRVVPGAFRDPRIGTEAVSAASAALRSVRPLVDAVTATAEEEMQPSERFELQRLDGTLRRQYAGVSDRLTALTDVAREADAEPVCRHLKAEGVALIATGAQAISRVT
jgi:pimeloyl-ACP methyl ester carboxylesterase